MRSRVLEEEQEVGDGAIVREVGWVQGGLKKKKMFY